MIINNLFVHLLWWINFKFWVKQNKVHSTIMQHKIREHNFFLMISIIYFAPSLKIKIILDYLLDVNIESVIFSQSKVISFLIWKLSCSRYNCWYYFQTAIKYVFFYFNQWKINLIQLYILTWSKLSLLKNNIIWTILLLFTLLYSNTLKYGLTALLKKKALGVNQNVIKD